MDENKPREASEGLKRNALLIQLAGDSGYLAAWGPVLTCHQALMAIFWVLPTVTYPKREQQDRKRKLLQHSRNLSNISLQLLCFPGLLWEAKHVSACLSPSTEAPGPKGSAFLQVMAAITTWAPLPTLTGRCQTLPTPCAMPIYLHPNSQWRFQSPVPKLPS